VVFLDKDHHVAHCTCHRHRLSPQPTQPQGNGERTLGPRASAARGWRWAPRDGLRSSARSARLATAPAHATWPARAKPSRTIRPEVSPSGSIGRYRYRQSGVHVSPGPAGQSTCRCPTCRCSRPSACDENRRDHLHLITGTRPPPPSASDDYQHDSVWKNVGAGVYGSSPERPLFGMSGRHLNSSQSQSQVGTSSRKDNSEPL
jgi:hypothetical protein